MSTVNEDGAIARAPNNGIQQSVTVQYTHIVKKCCWLRAASRDIKLIILYVFIYEV